MKYLILFLLISQICVFSQNRNVAPIVSAIEGKRAFDDLQKLYKEKIKPPYKAAFDNLNEKNDSVQKSAAAYINALFVQSFDDETNGRTKWEKMPFFNETWESSANNFRQNLSRYFSINVNSVLLVPTAEWLIFTDNDKNNQLEGIKVICRINSEESNKILEKIIKKPEINHEVVAKAIMEAANRHLINLKPDIEKLQNHYSSKIRDAVRNNTSKLNLDIADFDPKSAITPWLDRQFLNMCDMIFDKVPPSSKFVNIEEKNKYNDEEYKRNYTGWLLEEDSITYHLLDCYGNKSIFKKENSKLSETSLQDESQNAIKNKGIWANPFFTDWCFIPKFTIAAWCYQKNLKKEAASIILPIIDIAGDDSSFHLIIRENFGHLYHIQMLGEFSNSLDYNKALEYADHLSKPLFDGYSYQKRAKELAEQIRHRSDDFTTFNLPNKQIWDSLKLKMNRKEQIIYLADRIRLLNCIQYSQPGNINYRDEQHLKISNEQYKLISEQKLKYEDFIVINPYNELLSINLTIGELQYLIPYIKDENFIPSYSYWRDFHYSRNLFRVSYVVADILFRISHKDLADMNNFESLDDYAKQKRIDSLIKWCEDNNAISKNDLILGILQSTNDWKEFQSSMNIGFKDSLLSMIPILIKRLNDFTVKHEWPSPQGKIAKVVYELSSNAQLEIARKWQMNPDKWVKLYSSLILLKFGNTEKLEGLDTLKGVLSQCDGRTWYPDAIPVLIEINKPETMKLADGILEARGFKDKFYWECYSDLLRRLILAGSEKAIKFMVDGLENTEENEDWSKVNKGKTLLYSENYAESASKWHIDKFEYSSEFPVEKKIQLCQELSKWLQEQFQLIKTGKPHNINSSFERKQMPVESLDSP